MLYGSDVTKLHDFPSHKDEFKRSSYNNHLNNASFFGVPQVLESLINLPNLRMMYTAAVFCYFFNLIWPQTSQNQFDIFDMID